MDDPRATADNGTAGYQLAADLRTARRNDTLERKPDGGMEAERFHDARVQVGEALRFRPRYQTRSAVFDSAGRDRLIELGHQLFVAAAVLE